MDEERTYSETIDWCACCPAHVCLKDGKGCRCGKVDRKIPKKYEIEMSFPPWCPLPDMAAKKEIVDG